VTKKQPTISPIKRRDNGEIRRLSHFSATVWTGFNTLGKSRIGHSAIALKARRHFVNATRWSSCVAPAM